MKGRLHQRKLGREFWVLPDTLVPNMLVQSGVDSHVIGSHLLLGKLLDLLDSTGSTVFEPNSV